MHVTRTVGLIIISWMIQEWGGITPIFLNIDSGWDKASGAHSGRFNPGYTLNRNMDGPQILSGRIGEEVNFWFLPRIEPPFLGRVCCSLRAIPVVCSGRTILNSALKNVVLTMWPRWRHFNVWDSRLCSVKCLVVVCPGLCCCGG